MFQLFVCAEDKDASFVGDRIRVSSSCCLLERGVGHRLYEEGIALRERRKFAIIGFNAC